MAFNDVQIFIPLWHPLQCDAISVALSDLLLRLRPTTNPFRKHTHSAKARWSPLGWHRQDAVKCWKMENVKQAQIEHWNT